MRDAVTKQAQAVAAWLQARLMTGGRERGDMVGWVLITVMTAALVAVLDAQSDFLRPLGRRDRPALVRGLRALMPADDGT